MSLLNFRFTDRRRTRAVAAAVSLTAATVMAVAGPSHAVSPVVVGTAATPDGTGWWTVDSAGAVTAGGTAKSYGSLSGMRLNRPVVGIAGTPDGDGYWLVASDGGIFSFGDARFFGSTGNLRLAQPIVGMTSTPDGGGYWMTASDGGVFSFGDARFLGSTGGMRLSKPVVGMAPTSDGAGYWLVASDGGMFTFGDARFFGSTGNLRITSPIVGMASTADRAGYWLVSASGNVFSFGDAAANGSAQPGSTTFGIVGTPGGGYTLLTDEGPQHMGPSITVATPWPTTPAPAPTPAAPAPTVDLPSSPPTTVGPTTALATAPAMPPPATPAAVQAMVPPQLPAPIVPVPMGPSTGVGSPAGPSSVPAVVLPERFIGYWNAFGSDVGQLQTGETYGWGPSWDDNSNNIYGVRPEYQGINIAQASRTIAEQAHAAGDRYVYKPLLTNRSISPSSSNWFTQYLDTVLLPVVTGNSADEPDAIMLETELDGAIGSSYDTSWRALIADLRAAGYKGKLIGMSDNRYLAGWWNDVDYVAGDFYPSIDTSSLAAATASWQQQVGWQVDAYAQSGKPVMFGELGSYQESMTETQWFNYLGGLFASMKTHPAWAGALFWSGWGGISATQPQPQSTTAPPIPSADDLSTAAKSVGLLS